MVCYRATPYWCTLAKAASGAQGLGKGRMRNSRRRLRYIPRASYIPDPESLYWYGSLYWSPRFVPARLRHITRNCAPTTHAPKSEGTRPYARYEHNSGRLLLRRRPRLLLLRRAAAAPPSPLDEAYQDGDERHGDKGRADGALVLHDARLRGDARHLAGVEVLRARA